MAWRLGWSANVLDVPGHVLVVIGAEATPVIVDPFMGGVRVGAERLAALVEAATGLGRAETHLAAMPNRAVLIRLLQNQASRAELAGRVLFYIERIGAVLGRALDLDRSLAECARKNLYVTGSGMWSETYLQRCLEIVGPERLLFSTDFPYQYRPGGGPRHFVENVKLNDATRNSLAYGNWERLSAAAGGREDRAR
jgi:hypothetical protein